MSTMSKTDANISENKNNILITLLASICSLGPLATDMYLPALPQMTLDFATTPSIIQLTLTKCERKAPKFIYGDISSLKNNDSISLFFIVLYF